MRHAHATRPDIAARTRTLAGRSAGLTLLEVIIALAVVGVVTALLSTAVVGNLQKSRTFGGRTQAGQILNYFGRRVAGGDRALLPASGTPLSYDYGTLKTSFKELTSDGGFADPDRYRVDITNVGSVTLSSASAVRYDVTVCFQASGGESCVVGTTLGAAPSAASGTVPPLPGIN